MRLWPRRSRPELAERSDPVLSADDWARLVTQFTYGGMTYTLPGQNEEEMTPDYSGMAAGSFGSNSPVFACELARMLLFSEARFQWRQLRSGRPGKLFGSADLAPLEEPWPNGTTGDLLRRVLLHADLGGNAYVARRPGGGFALLRPDWVDILVGSRSGSLEVKTWDWDAEIIGYVYYAGGKFRGEPVLFARSEVAHFAPIPDPTAQFRGMSWLTPVCREVLADKATTEHKLRYFNHGATPNLLVRFNVDDLEKFTSWTDKFREEHEGASNAYKTLFVGAGMDVEAVGNNLEQIDFKVTQGAGETRIAMAARVPPIIVGMSEGLASATYSNYGMARRAFADLTLRPLWRDVCGSLSTLVNVPGGAELWYDDRDIPFLAEDVKDAAVAIQLEMAAIRLGVDGGFVPDTVVAAVVSGDLSLLQHTGMLSVQVQPPGTPVNGAAPAVRSNGGGELAEMAAVRIAGDLLQRNPGLTEEEMT